MAKFNINFSDGRSPLLGMTKQEFDKAVLNYIPDLTSGIAVVEEIAEVVKVKKSDTEEYQEARDMYMATLTATDWANIREGRKVVSHSQEKGFYLALRKNVKGEEIHISLSEVEKEIKKDLKSQLYNLLIQPETLLAIPDFSREEKIAMVNEIFKMK